MDRLACIRSRNVLDRARSREVLQQVRALLDPVLPVPEALGDLPLELWLMRPVTIETAAVLMGDIEPKTVRKRFRNKLIQIDGRRFGLRLYEALLLGSGA
jgi:hypothetical protein